MKWLPVIALLVASPAVSQNDAPSGEPGKVLVRGAMVLHWEHPHFVTNDIPRERAFEIRIEDEQWRDRYFVPARRDAGRATVYLCVLAEGAPDFAARGSTGRPTFRFQRVLAEAKVASENDCFP